MIIGKYVTRKEMYDVTPAQAINNMVDDFVKVHPDLNKKQARILICNALLYNCVIDAVFEQVEWLADMDEEEI